MLSASPACAIGGALLVGSGAVYGLVALVTGASMEGPVSLRKPILFGLSAGVTLLSAAWVAGALAPRRGDRWLYGSLALALVLEVALIDLQQARGVASHFNRATPFDEGVTRAMGALVAWATGIFAVLTARALGRMSLPPDQALAARAGLVLFLVGCGLGGVITVIGEAQAAGSSPEIYGAAGVLKFPHGIPLHALQILPLAAVTLERLGVPVEARTRAVARGAWATVLFTGYGLAQTFAGQPRWPPAGLGWLLAGLGIVALAGMGLAARPRIDAPRPDLPTRPR